MAAAPGTLGGIGQPVEFGGFYFFGFHLLRRFAFTLGSALESLGTGPAPHAPACQRRAGALSAESSAAIFSAAYAQMEKRAEALRQAPIGALRILACHHPLIEMVGTPMTGDVKRGDEAALIFAEAGVDIITTGHVPVPFALPINLGDHCSYAIGCGTLSHRERGAPPGFNQIDWDAKTITVTALAWDGTSYRSHQVWRLPRRQDTRKATTAPSPVEPGELEKAAV